MTHPLAALIAGVPRYIRNGHDMVKSPDGPWLHQIEVLAALEAAPVPDLVEAGKVLEGLEDADPFESPSEAWDAEFHACNTIRSLIALATAQAAQIAATDKAIAEKGGTIHAPTQWAYDQACAAIEKHRARAEAEVERLRGAGDGLHSIVEGIQGAMQHGTWRDEKGQRLKDTPEWVAFYNARAAITEATQ